MLPDLTHYEHAAPTESHLDWVDLPTVDLALASTAEGREELAATLRDAMKEHGFFSVINHGLTPEETSRMFDIADIPFSHVAEDDKAKYVADIKATGSYEGYKLRQYWVTGLSYFDLVARIPAYCNDATQHIAGGVRDQIEHYNVNRNVEKREHPPALHAFLPEIARFAQFNHERVLHPLLRLFARGMDLPEETFVDMHKFDAVGETSVRFMKYYPREEGDEETTKSVWLKGHTDIGTVTILWSQPVSALQILAKDGTWRWVRHVPNGLVINAGDALEFLSGGFYKATIHRVVQPPEDQRNKTRLGLFYFCTADDSVKLEPLVANPEYEKRFEVAPTMEEWRKGVTRAYGRTKLTKQDATGRIEKETIAGVLVRHFN